MNNKEFDQFIKKSMEQLKDDQPSDWSFMEQKLNSRSDSEMSSEMEDIYLDGVAYDHLNNLQEPFEPAHWEMMSARLDEEYAYRRKVMITKAMEVLVVFLLLWTAVNFFPKKKITPLATPPIATQNIEQQKLQPIFSTPTDQNAKEHTDKIISTSKNILTEQTDLANNTSTKTNSSLFQPTTTVTNSANESIFNNGNSLLENEKPTVGNVLSIASRSMALKNKTQNGVADIEIENNLIVDQEEAKKHGILKRTILAIISPLKSKTPSLLETEDTFDPDLEKMLAMRKAKPKGLMVSMFGSSDFNYALTNYKDVTTAESLDFRRGEFSYGGGVTLAFQMKKLLVETGVIYNFIQYDQLPDQQIIGSLSEGFTEQELTTAEINLIQVPLHFQYRIFQRNRWSVYGLAGGALNLAVQNTFAFQETNRGGSQGSLRSNEPKAFSNLIHKYDGLFEGGDLKTNSYLTANFGFGVERYFTYRWSMFVQPIYRHNFLLDGIGPKSDRINSSSIQVGAKVRLR